MHESTKSRLYIAAFAATAILGLAYVSYCMGSVDMQMRMAERQACEPDIFYPALPDHFSTTAEVDQ